MTHEKTAIKKLWVVGDKLKEFSRHESVITISELEKIITCNKTCHQASRYIIYLGQGVAIQRIKNLTNHVKADGLTHLFEIQIPNSFCKSSSQLTHKIKSKNIMISEPEKINNDQYQCLLFLEDECAEMSDHITGQHIQGMVLIEAARQMVIAVTKKYHFDYENKAVKFVTHKIDSEHHHFIFPLPVVLSYQIVNMKNYKNNNLSSIARISFIQNGMTGADITFKFSTISSEYITEKESLLAEQCIQSYLGCSAVNTAAVMAI